MTVDPEMLESQSKAHQTRIIA